MAARFRKIGVTTLGACAGLGLAGWALNPFDRQYGVSLSESVFHCGSYSKCQTHIDNSIFPFEQYVNAAAIATPRVKRKLPPRSEQVQTLQSGEEYDVIVIGGGATGAGCALDAITRGMTA